MEDKSYEVDKMLNTLIDLAGTEVEKAKSRGYFGKDFVEAATMVIALAKNDQMGGKGEYRGGRGYGGYGNRRNDYPGYGEYGSGRGYGNDGGYGNDQGYGEGRGYGQHQGEYGEEEYRGTGSPRGRGNGRGGERYG